MPCGCKKRMAAMKASRSPAMRKIADAIGPAHNAAMKVVDRWEARKRLLQARKRSGKRHPARIIGQPIPPSEN